MSSNLISNVTITGNLFVTGTSNTVTLNSATFSSPLLSFGNLPSTTVSTIAAGFYHTAMIVQGGTVRTFGTNAQGQLGVNDTVTRLTPVQVWGISSSALSLACGYSHTAVILLDGTVRTFGRNDTGQLGLNDTTTRSTPVQVFGISSSAVAVACGFFHTAVLLSNGTVLTFGNGASGRLGLNDTTSRLTPVQVWGISSTAIGIACGAYHTAILLGNGTVWMFGFNNTGQLGLNDTASRSTPVQVLNITSATSIAGGKYHTAVLLANGTVWTFGFNNTGQLGLNDTASRLTPVQVFGISSSAVAIACGFYSTSILLADGTVRAFGTNAQGQLGLNDTANRQTPVQVWGISSNACGIAGGNSHTAIILTNGTVRTVGANGNGQLGVGDITSRSTPVAVTGLIINRQARIAGAGNDLYIITSTGTVRCCGYNVSGELGVNDTASRSTVVQMWGISSSATKVAGSTSNSAAILLANGTVLTVGRNDVGQLGIGDTTSRLTPVQVLNIFNATAVACGSKHMAILLNDGTVRAFGANATGQLGVNDTVSRLTAVQVLNLTSATAVACGDYHTAVLLSNGTVWTFGRPTEGQLGVNDTVTRSTPVQVLNITSATAVACGKYHTIVLLADGTVRAFGKNNVGQLGVNDTTNRSTPVQTTGVTNATAIATGGSDHTVILLADGTIYATGLNTSGQLGQNDTTNRSTVVPVTAITSATGVACGASTSYVNIDNNSILAFGLNQYGQLGVNDTVTRSTPVQVLYVPDLRIIKTALSLHTAYAIADGTVRTFGLNNNGQLGVNDTVTRSTPVQVWGISSSAVAVSCGRYHTAVVLADGTIRTFGRPTEGQLGVNDTVTRSTPVQVLNITSATAVACGRNYTAVLLANGTVWAFGQNNVGQLGVNDTTNRSTPVQVWGISSSAVAIACGYYHTLVLLADGTVRSFGFNNNANGGGTLGVNDTTSRLTPVTVLVVTSAVAIACGWYHSVCLLADGTPRTFGQNSVGQLGTADTAARLTPSTIYLSSNASSGLAGIGAGYRNTYFLKKTGKVFSVGGGSSGALGTNSTINDNGAGAASLVGITFAPSTAVMVSGGYYCASILFADGTTRTFGNNAYGQLGLNDTVSRLTPVQVVSLTAVVQLAVLAAAVTLSTVTSVIASFYTSQPYIQIPGLNLGPVANPIYQLELSTDLARKSVSTTWTTGSDERIKSDIESANVARCVEVVQNLDLKYFKWDFPDGAQPADTHSLGWIAQEVEQFFPNAVQTSEAHGIPDFKNLNSDQLIKVMWGALKKLRADLKARKSSGSV